MLKVLNVATPATAATVFVPDRVPAPGFAEIDTVTLLVKLVIVLPTESRAVTCTAGDSTVVAVVVTGWAVKTSADNGPRRMLNVLLVAPASPLDDADNA